MICIYHSRDLDGYCSGAIVKHKYPEAVLIGYDYGQPIPWDQIPAGEPVIMVDVSFPMDEMFKLAVRALFQLTWIDHHASAIKDHKEFCDLHQNFDWCVPVLKDGRAACEGAWEYLFPNNPMPIAVLMLGIYDTWRKNSSTGLSWEEDILPFQFGMRVVCTSPETFPTALFQRSAGHAIERTVSEGKAILAYQRGIDAKDCERAFEFIFHSYRVVAMNGCMFNSNAFDSVFDPEKHDIMMPFKYDGKAKKWIFSMYTRDPNIDVSVVAKWYGGGGHKAAAGFVMDDLKFLNQNL